VLHTLPISSCLTWLCHLYNILIICVFSGYES
jgi:hypothetical protein